ncbi:hypothetical protein EGT07_08050 [Herbaspirillum sp. HC18]|nr:hypothetical protein EGT07_08050 [Herbaspirillum sp. HC18]
MRYYMTVHGRLTTITVSDQLSEYLVLKLGGGKIDARSVKQMVQAWVNRLAWESADEVPDKDVSQWVQGRILEFIVDPDVHARRAQMLKPTKRDPVADEALIWNDIGIINELRKRPRSRKRQHAK